MRQLPDSLAGVTQIPDKDRPVKKLCCQRAFCRNSSGVLCLLSIIASLCEASAQDAKAPTQFAPVPVVPLVAPNPGQKLLVIVPNEELRFMQTTCQQLRLAADFAENFDARRRDYGSYHAIVVGSNRMDYFNKAEAQAPEAFQPIVDFVAASGHLLMFGTYNGRNMEHLKRFDIQATEGGGAGFVRVPYASDALFAGTEDLLPKDDALNYVGRFSIARPHIVMLHRSDGDPAVATMPFGDGRVTMTMVEPHVRNDLWLFRVILGWHLRGAPSRLPVAGMFGVAAAAKTTARLPVPEDSETAKRLEAIQAEFAADYRQLKPWNATFAKELARKLLDRATKVSDSTLGYVLLTEARNLAAKSGDAATVLNATEDCGRKFQTDPLAILQDELGKASSACRSASDSRTVVDVAMMGTIEAVNVKQFDIADELLTLAGGNARRARVADLPKQIAAMKQAVSDARKATSGK